MENYLALLEKIRSSGFDTEGRNGMTRHLFAQQLRFDLRRGFPLLTTKRVYWETIAGELLWFIEGGRRTGWRLNEHRLNEILKRPSGSPTIWTKDAQSPRWLPKAKFEGDCGRIYGAQWRHWVGSDGKIIDQLACAITVIRNDPWERQMKIVTARNPAELDDMCLPPCHERFQFFVEPDEKGKPRHLSLGMTQRSCDMFLGVPFNIASYALLLAMVAQITGLYPKELVIDFMDVHIYHIHFDAVGEQLTRTPYSPPAPVLSPGVAKIDDFKMKHIRVIEYRPQPGIKAEMAIDSRDKK